MRPPRDPELDALFDEFGGDEDLREFAQALRTAPQPVRAVEPTPAFRVALRRNLMREAWRQASRPTQPWYRRLLAPPALAWTGAAVGALLIAFAGLTVVLQPASAPTTVTVSSPLERMQTVSVVEPIDLQFNAPMDRESVKHAVQIEPATAVSYQWKSDNEVVIRPDNNRPLAANVQYTVKVSKSAKTQGGQALTAPKTLTFVTTPPQPPPTPTPSASPTTVPAPSVKEVKVAPSPAGTVAPRWSSDGNLLYVAGPGGQLQAWSPSGDGTNRPPNAPDGVGAFAVAPDGPAFARNGQLVYGQVTILNVQPIAVGFHGGEVAYASTHDALQGTRGARLATFSEEAQAADFSPGGDRLAYRSTTGMLHLVDLTSGRDTQVGPATALGDWAPSTSAGAYAYPADGGVMVTMFDAQATPKPLVDLPGVNAVSWSHGDQLLLATSSAIYLANGDGTGKHKLQDGVYLQPSWSPAGGSFAFRRADQRGQYAYVGSVNEARAPAPASTVSQDDLVNNFMAARKAQQQDRALSFLDPAGQAAFRGLSDLIFPDSSTLARYYVLLSQPGHVVVRIVTSQGGARDETLTLQNGSGGLLIHSVFETARPMFGNGPEVLRVETTGGQVRVSFDSDLNPGSVPGAVTIKGVSSQATYDQRTRTVVLTVPGGITPGSPYYLEVSPTLQDVSGRNAQSYGLPFTGPAS